MSLKNPFNEKIEGKHDSIVSNQPRSDSILKHLAGSSAFVRDRPME